MFSYIAKSLVSKTLKTALGQYLEDIELESIDYGGKSEETGSGWGVRLSSVKLREGMELAKLPGQRKRRCNPANTESDAMGASNKHAREEPSVIINGDAVEIDAKAPKSRPRIDSADNTDGGSISSTPATPPQSGRGVCGASNVPFWRSGSTSRKVVVVDASKHGQELPEMQLLEDKQMKTMASAESPQTILDDARITNEVENAETGDSENDHSNTEDDAGDGNISLVVGSGGIIGQLKIGMVGKELSITIEDAHLILEVVVDAKDDSEGSDSSAADDHQPRTSSRSSSVSSEVETPAGDSDKSSTGDKIKQKSTLAKYLSSIPHIFLRDCRVSLILPEEGSDSKDTCEDCTVFELGIDFLSVTSGDDFLDTLRFGAKEKTPLKKKAFRRSSLTSEAERHMPLRRASSLASENPASAKNVDVVRSIKLHNSYGWKVIRTGKGPEGGIWMKVFVPSYKSKPLRKTEHRWARQRYMDTAQTTLFAVSAVDFHARLLMDTKDSTREVETVCQDEYEDYTLDSMLFGVDYIDPISLTRHQVNKHEEQMRKDQSESMSSTRSDEATREVDRNGNQLVPFSSNLHRLAKRAHSGQKTISQEATFDFYEDCVGPTTDVGSMMDDYTPLPGFCFCLSVADPVEVNVDRDKLDAIGYLTSLFTPSSDDAEKDQTTIDDEHSESPNHQQPNVGSLLDERIQNDAFPSYMQPDSIFLSGVHLAKVIVRVEIMKSAGSRGLGFSYWQLSAQSLHIEDTRVDTSNFQLNDTDLHLGGVDWVERNGVCSNSLVVAGLDAVRDEDCPKQSQSSILCTAARVLGIAVPVSADSRLNSVSALQCKLISTRCPGHYLASRISFADVRLGKLLVDLGNTLPNNIAVTVHESLAIVTNEELASAKSNRENADQASPEQPKSHSMLVSVATSGGTLAYRSKVQMTIPCSKVRIARGSAEGLSIENLAPILLDQFNFGAYHFNRSDKSSTCLGSLPETLRMRVLLFLGDLTPLEKALGVKSKKKTSMFIRSHAVNKILTKRGSKKTTAKEAPLVGELSTRRLALLAKLNALDNDSLEGLLAMHDRSKL